MDRLRVQTQARLDLFRDKGTTAVAHQHRLRWQTHYLCRCFLEWKHRQFYDIMSRHRPRKQALLGFLFRRRLRAALPAIAFYKWVRLQQDCVRREALLSPLFVILRRRHIYRAFQLWSAGVQRMVNLERLGRLTYNCHHHIFRLLNQRTALFYWRNNVQAICREERVCLRLQQVWVRYRQRMGIRRWVSNVFAQKKKGENIDAQVEPFARWNL